MKLKTNLLLLYLFFSLSTLAQKEWSNWYLNNNTLLTFNTPANKGQLVHNFTTAAPNDFTHFRNIGTDAISYSDPVSGEMKFLIANRLAFDKNYQLINSASSLRVCGTFKYGIHIIPFPNDPNRFYILQFQSLHHDLLQQESGLQVRCPNALGFGYSIFNLQLNGGLGGFESMNNVLLSGVPERISLVRHANGKDVWAVVHSWGDNRFHSYLFTSAGVQQPVISAIGPTFSGRWPEAVGNMSASHDGKTLAAQKYRSPFMELYDFNNSNGVLSNYRTLNTREGVDRIVFSPDDSKLYFIGDYANPGLFQFDLSATDIQGSLFKVAEDKSKTYWDMQVGLDGRLYIAAVQTPDLNYFSVVNCPNLPKFACNFVEKAMTATNYSLFPNFINDYVKEQKAAPVTEFSLGKDTAVCFGSITLSAPQGWDTYKWNTGETTRQITVTEPGEYFVLAGEWGFSCPSAFGSIRISDAARKLNLGRDTTLCPGDTHQLTVPAGFSNMVWNDGSTDRQKLVASYGAYSVTAFDEKGCRSRDTVVVGYRYYPKADFGSDTTLCSAQSLLLKLEPPASFGGGQYLWQDGSEGDSYLVTRSGLYWGQSTYQGCTIADTIRVSFVTTQSVSLGSDTTMCVGDSLRLQVAVPGANILWSTGETAEEIRVKTSGVYWVKVNMGSCTIVDTINITFQPKPTFTLGPDTSLCEQQTLRLDATVPGATYLWQDGSTGSSLLVSQAGTYWAQVNSNGCSTRDSINVMLRPLPVLNLGKDTVICTGESLQLNAAHISILSYEWQNGAATPTQLVQHPGMYWVRATGVNGCIRIDTINVTAISPPAFTLGADTVLCERQILSLSFQLPNAAYQWSTGHTSNAAIVNAPGLYWLDVTQNGCRKRDSIVVAYKPLPLLNLGGDTVLCEGAAKLLDATNSGATYLWQNGSTAPQLLVTTPGRYGVIVSKDGCNKSDEITIAYRSKPMFTLGLDTVMCLGTNIILQPTVNDATLRWQDGAVGNVYTISSPGIYRLTATNQCGSYTDDILVEKTLCRLLLPNAFTPNRDGLNDFFRIKNSAFIKSLKMTIYNRWGEIVFSANQPDKGWDGRYKGVDQPEGAYVWTIEVVDIDGNKESGKGTVLLLR